MYCKGTYYKATTSVLHAVKVLLLSGFSLCRFRLCLLQNLYSHGLSLVWEFQALPVEFRACESL